MRKSETEGRAGKQPDGSAGTREMKLAVVWIAETTDEEAHRKADTMSTSYNAAIESARMGVWDKQLSAFAQRVEREAHRRGFYEAERQVVIGDGARWIWHLVDEIFPRTVQTVDFYHAREKVRDVAKSVYGLGTDLTGQWAQAQVRLLKAGDIEALLEVISDHCATNDVARNAFGYFTRNRERMRYQAFRDDQLCVSSGIVEAGCKNAIGARLKRGGMHWSVDGANKIAALRNCIHSNRFEEYW